MANAQVALGATFVDLILLSNRRNGICRFKPSAHTLFTYREYASACTNNRRLSLSRLDLFEIDWSYSGFCLAPLTIELLAATRLGWAVPGRLRSRITI